MAEVQTVRGPVDTAELGRTYMHEHVFVLTPDVQQNYPDEWGDEDDRVADAVGQAQGARRQGVRTIVDPTVIGLGRYIPRIQRIAEQVPGPQHRRRHRVYTYNDVPFFFHHRGPALGAALGTDVPDPMVDLFVGDITRRHRRHRRAGRHAQVRHRPPGPDRTASSGCMRAVAQAHRRDRRADHRAHPPRQPDRASP